MGIPCCFLTWSHACGWSTTMADPYFHHQMVSREMVKILPTTRAPGVQSEVKEKASKAGGSPGSMAKVLWQPVTVSLLGVNPACDSPPQGQARLCNHRPRKSLHRPKASSYSRRGLSPHPGSHVGCIVPLGSDTAPALDRNLPIHTVAAHKGGVCVYVCRK